MMRFFVTIDTSISRRSLALPIFFARSPSWMDDVVRFSCQKVVSFFSLSGQRPECNSVSFTKKRDGFCV
jgi:hypothetical protein